MICLSRDLLFCEIQHNFYLQPSVVSKFSQCNMAKPHKNRCCLLFSYSAEKLHTFLFVSPERDNETAANLQDK